MHDIRGIDGHQCCCVGTRYGAYVECFVLHGEGDVLACVVTQKVNGSDIMSLGKEEEKDEITFAVSVFLR